MRYGRIQYDRFIDGAFECRLYKDGAAICGVYPRSRFNKLVVPKTVAYTTATGERVEKRVLRIDDGAFYNCKSFKSVVLPEGLEEIGAYAFAFCGELRDVYIPDSTTKLGVDAFRGCFWLETVRLSNRLTEIPRGAFAKCVRLKTATIPKSVRIIGYEAFFKCGALRTLFFSEGIETICARAFYQCDALENVSISKTVAKIGAEAFFECQSLKTVVFSYALEEIGARAFKGCSALVVTSFFKGLAIVGAEAFEDCVSLKTVCFQAGLKEVRAKAFRGCNSLTAVVFSGALKLVDNFAFENCASLAFFTCPGGIKLIGEGAFRNCPELPTENLYDEERDGRGKTPAPFQENVHFRHSPRFNEYGDRPDSVARQKRSFYQQIAKADEAAKIRKAEKIRAAETRRAIGNARFENARLEKERIATLRLESVRESDDRQTSTISPVEWLRFDFVLSRAKLVSLERSPFNYFGMILRDLRETSFFAVRKESPRDRLEELEQYHIRLFKMKEALGFRADDDELRKSVATFAYPKSFHIRRTLPEIEPCEPEDFRRFSRPDLRERRGGKRRRGSRNKSAGSMRLRRLSARSFLRSNRTPK